MIFTVLYFLGIIPFFLFARKFLIKIMILDFEYLDVDFSDIAVVYFFAAVATFMWPAFLTIYLIGFSFKGIFKSEAKRLQYKKDSKFGRK